MKDYTVVPFSKEHIERAAKIEEETFSEPWSREAMRLLCTPEYPSLALVDGEGQCIGYIGSSKALDELAIINVAVDAKYRGQGLSKLIMRGFEGLCEELDISLVSLEVRESNFVAISLYESFGFSVAGKRKAFYRAPTEDALVMIKNCREGR